MDIAVNGLLERNESGKNQTNGHASADWQYKHLSERLEQIGKYLEKEIELKQRTIDLQLIEIEKLQQQLQQSIQHTEGHRQLINKLLNDIEHYQNDIDWYKRTYERRSIWGILKERLGKKV